MNPYAIVAKVWGVCNTLPNLVNRLPTRVKDLDGGEQHNPYRIYWFIYTTPPTGIPPLSQWRDEWVG